MCGIAGIFDLKGDYSRQFGLKGTLLCMNALQSKRGPDDQDIWLNSAGTEGLAHTRLSIVDLTKYGKQPMTSNNMQYIMVLNGEIYNHDRIRKELLKKGVVFRGHSDSEVALEAMVYWGVAKAVQKFIGMFSIALWDQRNRVLTLVRDRMGEKPLYYGNINGVLAFSSDLAALKCISGFSNKIYERSVNLYLRLSYVPEPLSIFENIHKLEQATILEISLGEDSESTLQYIAKGAESYSGSGKIKYFRYWSPPTPETSSDILASQMSQESIETLIEESVVLCSKADVKVGALLSGGIDSTVITALLQKNSDIAIPSFTIGFEDPKFNEASYADSIAKVLGTEHNQVIIGERDLIEIVDKMPNIYSEPFGDSSQIPTFLLSKIAAGHIKVVLSGDGGDEVFGGYNRYKFAPELWYKLSRIPRVIRSILNVLFRDPSIFTTSIVYKVVSFLVDMEDLSNGHDKVRKLISMTGAKHKADLFVRIVSVFNNPDWLTRHKDFFDYRNGQKCYFTDNNRFEDQMILCDLQNYLCGDILVKVDRASMENGLEVRAPFLNHNLVSRMMSLPAKTKMQHGQTKFYLRELLKKLIPEKFISRPKMGFAVPLDSWLRNELKEWAQEILCHELPKVNSYLNQAVIYKMWNRHQANKYQYGGVLWNILMFLSWHRVFRS